TLPVRLEGSLVQARSPGLVTQLLKYPDPPRPPAEVYKMDTGVQIFAKDPETGREYATAYGAIKYNDNNGRGYWNDLWRTPTEIQTIHSARRLSNGRLLVVCSGSGRRELWASDLAENDTEKTFEKVLDFQLGVPYGPWGWDTTHEAVLLCSEYDTG